MECMEKVGKGRRGYGEGREGKRKVWNQWKVDKERSEGKCKIGK